MNQQIINLVEESLANFMISLDTGLGKLNFWNLYTPNFYHL